jgi:protocatechuate 3,4-dioxygenase beta subunit
MTAIAATSIAGRVNSGPDDDIRNVVVYLYAGGSTPYQEAVTDVGGRYLFQNLPPGSYRLCFDTRSAIGHSSYGYAGSCLGSSAPWGDANHSDSIQPPVTDAGSVDSTPNPADIDITLAPLGALTGLVTDTGGHPLIGARVTSVHGVSHLVRTDITGKEGSFLIARLRAGEHSMCINAADASSGSSDPGYLDTCSPVTITSDATTTVNTELDSASGIQGTVRSTGGNVIAGVPVKVYNASGAVAANTGSSADGTYQVRRLPAGSYRVCFDPRDSILPGADSYVDQCFDQVTWDGSSTIPPGATAVMTAAAAYRTGVDARLISYGTISGLVHDKDGAAISNALAHLFAANGSQLTSQYTDSDGHYTFDHLEAGSYKVCVDAFNAAGGLSTHGYAAECFDNVEWYGGSVAAAQATLLGVTAGQTVTADVGLTGYAQVSGTVTDSGGHPLRYASVSLMGTNSSYGMWTDVDGHYSTFGLRAGTYDVCFSTTSSTTSITEPQGLAGQCYQGVPWTGGRVPTGATHVTVTEGGTASGIDAALTPAGGIQGVVRDDGATPLSNVTVNLYDSTGTYIAYKSTQVDGSYAFGGLPPDNYQLCFDPIWATGGTASYGYGKQCYSGVPWSSYTVPAGTTPVVVSAGSATTGIDAHMKPLGRLTGTVTDADGFALNSVSVTIFPADGSSTLYAYTGNNGSFTATVPGGSYRVCYDPRYAHGGQSTTGYLRQCYPNVPWDGSSVPAGAQPASISAGVTTDASVSVEEGSVVSGTITDSSNAPLGHVSVSVITSSGTTVDSQTTGADGTYRTSSLTPGSYYLCFSGKDAVGSSALGYADECYDDAPWDGSRPPVGVSRIDVTTGENPGRDAQLADAAGTTGAVRGVVTDAAGAAIPDVYVNINGTQGNGYGFAQTDSAGKYVVRGLAPGTYSVCFDARYVRNGPSPTGYASECYDDRAWNGGRLPAAVKSVPVAVGVTTSGIDASLSTGGAVSGVVKSDSGTALPNVGVQVITPGGDSVADASTSSDGSYTVRGLPAGSYVVCFDGSRTTTGSSGGYVAECYADVVRGSGQLPTGTAPVAVTAGSTTAGINAGLAPAGGLSGAVTGVNGSPQSGSTVTGCDSSGNRAGSG